MMRRLWHWLWRSSIQRQLIAGVALVHMLLMTLFVFDLVSRQRRFLEERAKRRVQAQAQLLAANSLHGTLSLDLQALEEIVAAMQTQRYVHQAMITDPGGRVLAHTARDMIGLFRNDARTAAILQGPVQTGLVHKGADAIEAASPIVASGRLVGWVWVTNDLTEDQLYLAEVTDSGRLYTAAAILIGTLFAVLLARTVTRPLQLLLVGTERLASNRLDQPVPVTTQNEVGVLTGRFNEAMQRLSEQHSERERAEAALRRSEALYRGVARSIPNGGVWVIDRDQRCLVADGGVLNRLGTKEGHAEGALINEVFDEQTLAIVEPRFQRALAGEVASYETEVRGRVFWAHYLPLRNESGQVTAVMVLALDISERKRMEQDLRAAKEGAEEANRAKSEFLANMSHELRTPMTVIMSCLELLQNGDGGAEHHQFVQMAANAAHRLLGIIDDLLDISRIEAGRLRIEERPFGLRDCVGQAIEMFASPVREKGLDLQWWVAPHLPEEMYGDPDRIGQVLVNLIGNAVKFTDKGEIGVTVADAAEGVEFAIRDSGIGIAAGKIDQLFQPFTQVDSSLTRRHGGTGLGLAICRELVTLMGGAIDVQSDEGRGSTFRFVLPLRPVHTGAQASHPEDQPGGTGRPLRVLLAEDDPVVGELMQMILSQRGWEVIAAENGHQATARWAEGGIDVVLMDLQMPEMNGLEATRTIRERERRGTPRTPIIALTAHVGRENREECLAAGMDAFLEKPIRVGELFSLIDSCLDQAAEGRSGRSRRAAIRA